MIKIPFVKNQNNSTKNLNVLAESKPDITTSNFSNKRLLFALVTIILIIIISAGVILTQQINKSKPAPPSKVAYHVSTIDDQNQQVIKKLAGFDWSSVPKNLNGSQKQMLVTLLLSFSEETAVFWPEVKTVALTQEDISKLNLQKLPEDPKKENFQKLFDYLNSIENVYKDKGLIPANAHIERLNILKTALTKNTPSVKNKIPEDAKKISSDLKVADNQLDYSKTLLTRYNNWLGSLQQESR